MGVSFTITTPSGLTAAENVSLYCPRSLCANKSLAVAAPLTMPSCFNPTEMLRGPAKPRVLSMTAA